MWWTKGQNKLTAVLLMALMLAGMLSRQSLGAEAGVDGGRELSLTIRFHSQGKEVEGGSFCLYKVAEAQGDGELVRTEDFDGYPVSMENLDSAGWKALAATLAAYSTRDRLTPWDRGVRGVDGTLGFPVQEEMTPGLYLVVGGAVESEGIRYTPEPFLVSLPARGPEGDLLYKVTADVKYDQEETGPGPDTMELRVLKVWKDQGYEDRRPSRIVVQLLRDGEVWDRAVLNKEKNWRHVWGKLEKGHRWQVAEEQVPTGYTVKAEQEGASFLLTNTFDPPSRPHIPYTSKGGRGGHGVRPVHLPDEAVPLKGLEHQGEPAELSDGPVPLGGLPRTGVPWWPVPWLCCGGAALFILGRSRYKTEGFGEDRDM